MYFPSGFRAGCALSGHIAFEDYSTVKDISAKRKVKVFAAVVFKA